MDTVKLPHHSASWTARDGSIWRTISVWNGQFWQTYYQNHVTDNFWVIAHYPF